MATGDLIDFEVIDSHKENIQSLPGGRSARALAQIYSPPLTAIASPSAATDAQLKQRAAFERELLTLDEADDPLDIYDRYVKWTLEAFPSAQATPQSQLLPLLERATKAFQQSSQYKNDSRYLKLWLHYINLFSDTPRETFVFLARNSIGEGLAMYYEEYAAWLESTGRWNQAEEVYTLGLQKHARPTERLARKHNEFEQRRAAHTTDPAEPSSPALPIARPVLASKMDPFASAPAVQQDAPVVKKARTGKMQIFSDADEPERPDTGNSSGSWDNIGTIAERKKENTVAPRPMAGERLKTGKTNGGAQKMMVFRDTKTPATRPRIMLKRSAHERQCTTNANTGRLECVFVNLEAVYPQGSKTEFCFEELRAQQRKWQPDAKKKTPVNRSCEQSIKDMTLHTRNIIESTMSETTTSSTSKKFKIFADAQNAVPSPAQVAQQMAQTLQLADDDSENRPPQNDDRVFAKKIRREERANRTRKIDVMDVKHISNTTQTIQLNMGSPRATKVKRKKSGPAAEQTVTINTKEAMEEIYGMYSQPLSSAANQDQQDESDASSDYSSDGESTATGKLSGPTSEYGDETKRELYGTQPVEPVADVGDLTGWSDFTISAHRIEETHTMTSLPGEEADLIDCGHQEQDLPGDQEYYSEVVPEDEYEAQQSSTRANTGFNNRRLPFMTPIAELTESSMGTLTVNKQRELLSSKTPSRQVGSLHIDAEELLSSPFQEETPEYSEVKQRVLQPIRTKSTKGTLSLGKGSVQAQFERFVITDGRQGGPIVQDLQCNPMDPSLREGILAQLPDVVSSMPGYHAYDRLGDKATEIRRWAKSVGKVADKQSVGDLCSPLIRFDSDPTSYQFTRELGAGTFAPVFLVETHRDASTDAEQTTRQRFEAIKMEDPPSVWEYFFISQVHSRLAQSRVAQSIIQVYEMHLYRDECFLVEQYRDQGTLLDLVNLCRSENTSAAAMDETLAMWLSIELFRTVESLHARGLVHGDLKGDNIMVRLDDAGLETDWSATYCPSGAHGWASKGVCLIDFGRGIDMQHFQPDVGFVADWKTTEADCAEMCEMRPWTYQIDYHGLAGVLHSMLFGKYMEVLSEKGAGLGQGVGKTYRIRETLKRYWQTDIWGEAFNLLLNPLAHVEVEDDGKMPVVNGMRACREKMEAWLEDNCEKGIGLKGMITKLECAIREKRRRRRS